MTKEIYHSHLGKVQQAIVGEIRSALLNKAEIGQIHSEVWYERRIAAVQRLTHRPESSQIAGQVLQFIDYVFLLHRKMR